MHIFRPFAAGFVALTLLISIAPQAEAALTEPQIRAVQALLNAFGVDVPTIANINMILHNQVATVIVSGAEQVQGTALYCPKLTIDLSKGSRDSKTSGQVSELQKFLASYYNVPTNQLVTGYFGSLTEKYVKKLQIEKGISATGVAGSLTRAAIATMCGTTENVSPASEFLIQDVCLDVAGQVLALSPLSSQCAATRNLKNGERLPYHKHDLNGSDTNPAAVNGYQRSDSFPRTSDGTTITQTLDFGVGGSTFGVKDTGDGYNFAETRGAYASFTQTQDSVGGVQYFVSPACASGQGNEDAWALFPTSGWSATPATQVFSLIIASSSSACPMYFDQSLTGWEFPSQPLAYTSGISLISAISYHYSHPTVGASDHMEKFFFTKSFGATRWERWERPGTPYHTNEMARAAAKDAAGVCNGSSTTSDSIGPWYRVDCREWSKIIPAAGSSSNWFDPNSWSI